MHEFLGIAGGIIAAVGTAPYLLETIRGKTKPRVVTWLTWAMLTGVAAAAAFASHNPVSGIFALLGTVATGSVTIAGLRYGDRSFAALDVACMVGVIVGLVLWLLFNSPAIGVWAAVIIDFVGFIPTFKHAWMRPHEETASTFLWVAGGGALTTIAVALGGAISVTSIGYPAYVAASTGICAAVVLWRKQRLATPVLSKEAASD